MLTPKRKSVTETGQMPRYEPGTSPGEPPIMPPSLPEMDEPHSTTGIINIVSEGIDESKEIDDSIHARE